MKSEFDVVIVGAGMVGLSAACLLAGNDRLRVTVIDAGSRPEFSPGDDLSLRVSAIAPGSVDLLSRIGAWDGIVGRRASPFRSMKVWDAAGHVDGAETLTFDAAEFAVAELGFIVENVLIRHALLAQLERTGAQVRFGAQVRGIRLSGHRYRVDLDDEAELAPDLLIGADGARSRVRDCAGIGIRSWPHAQKAFVTVLQPELGHRETAWQRFLPAGPIGVLPLSDGRVSIVWSTTPARADEALQMTDEALSATLTEVTDGALGKLTTAGPRGAFPLVSQHANEYVRDGLALIGDAAHSIHPLAGQGVNLGFADVDTLAGVIGDAIGRDENPGDLPTLRRYERARKGANRTMLHFMDGLNRLFSNDSGPLARLRGLGMFLFNRSGPLRQHAVHTALGLR